MLINGNLNIKKLGTLIAFLYIGVMLVFASPPTEPEQFSVLVNADAIRRDNAYGQMLVYGEAKEVLRKLDKKGFRQVRRKYRISSHLYRKYSLLALKTEQKITELSVQNPDLLSHINQLTRENGSRVKAFVGSKSRLSLSESTGETLVRYERRNDFSDPEIVMAEESVKGILLLPRQYDVIKITLATDGSIVDTRHELGHFEVAVAQSKSYYQHITTLSSRERKLSGGHLFDDLSGHQAHKYENY